MSVATTADQFAAKLRERGAKNVRVHYVGGPDGRTHVLAWGCGSHYRVEVTAVFNDAGFVHAHRDDITARALTSMSAVMQALGLPPDRPYKVGYVNGGRLRPYRTHDEAIDAVWRLWAGDRDPMAVYQWIDGTFRRIETHTTRPDRPADRR